MSHRCATTCEDATEATPKMAASEPRLYLTSALRRGGSGGRSWRRCRRPGRNIPHNSAGALEDSNVAHVRVRSKPNAFQPPIGLGEDERAIARYLVSAGAVEQLLRRKTAAIFRHDH